MRSICFYFQVHQPFRLRTYRFFDIGVHHNYYDDYQNNYIIRRIAERCYLPMNQLLLDLIKQYKGKFKVSFSISGMALDQFEWYAPEVLDSFKQLAKTGCVEFLAETYAHSLASLQSEEIFQEQVQKHVDRMEQLFGQKPSVFRNTELIYSDEIGEMVHKQGFTGMITEGAKHILGWKSPNMLYAHATNPDFKLLLKNYSLSDDIAFRFSQRSWDAWPLTAEKYVDWLLKVDKKQPVVNLFMDYETFGEHHGRETGIFEFMKALPAVVFAKTDFKFQSPSELIKNNDAVAPLHVPFPISWADEERDLTAWLGNDLQEEAFKQLYALEEKMKQCKDCEIQKDWNFLQTSDHFYYMCTKWFSDADIHKYFNPYKSPYDAFINYMNVVTDLTKRVDDHIQHLTINKNLFINQKTKKMETTKSTTAKKAAPKKATAAKPAAKKAAPKKATAAKPAAKKAAPKKATAAKPAVKKAAPKKATAAKPAVKKAAPKKATAAKPAVKKAAPKKATAAKPAAKKAAPKKATAAKPAAKKAAPKKATAAKPAAKKAAPKKATAKK